MGFKVNLIILIILLINSSCNGQVKININKTRASSSIIVLNLQIENNNKEDVYLANFSKTYNEIDYFKPVEADSINYEGFSFLIFNEKDTLDIDNFLVNFNHAPKFISWLDFKWLKLRNKVGKNGICIGSFSKISKKIKVNLNGFNLKEDINYFLQIVYYKPNSNEFTSSNIILIR